MRKRHIIIIAIIAILFTPLCISFYNFKKYEVENNDLDEFITNLNNVIQENSIFFMTEVTHFEWDKMYVFGPYMSREVMEGAIGTKWHTEDSFFKYVINESSRGDYPLSDESLSKVVFVKENEVVLDITFDPLSSVVMMGNNEVYERHNSEFCLGRIEGRRTLIKL
ncbi:hypothetical protein I6N90_21445 [Paenibacillus sp. GSMTC-2017]|uniref:hypothetical protein n=1 Tax=Paenibacillus sp. GSMTC-2017 TaxID=2794350 RepID=UPI0018D7912D|nr:hypothetical protein [Paenibacillus sp. GSMTC-2017]MBH5320361.1 hypothetical protein [Paenibacillus sp. GSMTC-2017]